jgi:hypothetical protein
MRETRRTTGSAVLAAAVLALTAACGDDGGAKATATPTPLTAAQATTLAAAAVLTAADLPGYTAEKQTHDADDDAMDARLATCLGYAKPTYLARDFGTAFSKGSIEIDSSADVAPSVAVAKEELAALTSSKAEGCLKAEFEDLVASSGGTVTSFEMTPVTIDVPGADDAFGFSLRFAATAGGQRIAFSGYEVGSLVGPVEIDVSVIDSSGGSTFSLDAAVALLRKVTDRTKAAA